MPEIQLCHKSRDFTPKSGTLTLCDLQIHHAPLWGNPRREWLHVDDAPEVYLVLMSKCD